MTVASDHDPDPRIAELIAALAEMTRQRDVANRALDSVMARFIDLRRRVKALAESIQ